MGELVGAELRGCNNSKDICPHNLMPPTSDKCGIIRGMRTSLAWMTHRISAKTHLVAVTILMCASMPSAEVAAIDGQGTGRQDNENSSWVTLPDGTQALDVKWARGHSGKIITLRIPQAYVGPLMGPGNCHPFSPMTVDPNCQFDFAVGALLRAELPNLTSPPDVSDALTTQIQLTSTGLPGSRSAISIIRFRLQTQLSFLKAAGGKLRSLTKAGLSGIGLIPSPGMATGNIPIRPSIYFDASSPDLANTFIACPDDAISVLVSPSVLVGDEATCMQYFSIPGLEADVEMALPARFLDNWSEVAASTVKLVNSFEIGEQ